MNASEFIYGSLHLFDPILNAEFAPQGIALRQFTSRWEGGMVRTSGELPAAKKRWCWTMSLPAPGWSTPLQNWKTQWMAYCRNGYTTSRCANFGLSRNLRSGRVDPVFPVADHRPRRLRHQSATGERSSMGRMGGHRHPELAMRYL